MIIEQTAWAIVGTARGHIHLRSLSYNRKYVIEETIKTWRSYGFAKGKEGLTDAQFWRWLKKRNGWAVRRVQIKVMK